MNTNNIESNKYFGAKSSTNNNSYKLKMQHPALQVI